ncbi:glycoside hydrolase family 16 protein [Amycolatopsis alkalitolerans]|uniref:Glycoside hydrolase family 16 protein n=1 Tax=Amycolatopsis alkalitolerans TaxID=2547244 RepID=A0A5C4MAP6_9PSEU|nr:glycoside hydrolase family 16 protein [Amycolatopsis alkalitolerans]TNC29091.1 glycoside hydrolase family 16 protein [Amycolatopsis alkalitolerans]
MLILVLVLAGCSGGPGAGETEDFDGSSLDPARWVAYDGFNRASAETWRASQCTVSGGVLRLRADASGICGVASRIQTTYAKAEVRARFSAPAGQGLAPVFLFWPQNDNDWPQAGEIDWLECYDTSRRSFGSWIHYAGRGGNDESDYGGDFRVDMSQWHTYGVEWTSSQVRVSVDGQVWHTYTRHIPSGPMHLAFQINRIGPVTGVAEVEIDWVHVDG